MLLLLLLRSNQIDFNLTLQYKILINSIINVYCVKEGEIIKLIGSYIPFLRKYLI